MERRRRAFAHDRDHQPCRVRNFFHELSEMVAMGPPRLAQIGALAQNYGLEFGEPPMSRF